MNAPLLVGAALLAAAAVQPARAQAPQRVPSPEPQRVQTLQAAALADLAIREVQAVPGDDRKLRVRVVNIGPAASGRTNLKLFYHRSGQIMVRGTSVPGIAAGGEDWLLVDIGSPIAHASSVTLRVDDPDRVDEVDELNNGFVHK